MLKKHFLTILGSIFGLIASYLYYYHVGCVSRTCFITSRPLNSSLYGAILGGLIGNVIESKK
ncbi:signal peptidase II [Flavobacterium oreochromis]|uniref:YtxH domain-containing protein n=2 Tax=Flavobacterium TaxID=237 RepID=A0A246G9X3_9FLAO|nr:hypothetical protein [Flavobacterium oreochromis]OWP74517.1 hypothetical protein BWG23_13695 [Flavobacterium oreochromis]OWP76566.1 hypothetical protein BWK62_09520 [Flavobacterium oreochromis]POR20078.1 hypothetical protein BWK58_14125 [Flavobacterium columnare]QYS86134.1 hypothetical protein JJC03_14290 [Flavobacterium oreochromis]